MDTLGEKINEVDPEDWSIYELKVLMSFYFGADIGASKIRKTELLHMLTNAIYNETYMDRMKINYERENH
jgi:hypothetical protein